MTITTTKSAVGKTEGVLQSAEDAVENTRAYAQDSLDRAAEKVTDLRKNLEPAIDQLASRAEKAVRSSLEAVSHTSERAQQTLHRYADATGRYVADQPVKAVLIAAATGAAVAALFMALHGRNSRH